MIVILIGLGLIFGSFCNAAIWRLHAQQFPPKKGKQKIKAGDLSIVSGRSRCFHCGHELSPLDMVPVFSYLWLRGRCRYCGQPIADTPLTELLVPLLFVASYIWWPYPLLVTTLSWTWLVFGLWLLCIVAFVILAIYDLKWYLLPDRVVFPLIGLSIAMLLGNMFGGGGWQVILDAIWGVLCTAGVFYLFYLVSRGAWIGFGDVKLAIALGMLAGSAFSALLLIFIASLAGSLAAIPSLTRGKSMKGMRMPFGPYLLLATFIVVLFGQTLVGWYLGLFV